MMDTLGAIVGPASAFFLLQAVNHHYPTLFGLTLIPGLLAVAFVYCGILFLLGALLVLRAGDHYRHDGNLRSGAHRRAHPAAQQWATFERRSPAKEARFVRPTESKEPLVADIRRKRRP
jgi:hypothetical protein